MAKSDLTEDSDPLAKTVDVARDRYQMRLDAAVIDWVNDNSLAGGRFRSHGDAVERGWGRLQAEQAFIEARCKATKTPFKRTAFHAMYAAEIAAATQAIAPDGAGNYRSSRVKVFATSAVELAEHAKKNWVRDGPCSRLGEVAEIGVRRLQRLSHPADPNTDEPRMALPAEKFWQLYLQKLRA